ncbi:MAG: hypothetical protein KAH84_00620, partial [Thiomargarita sp.]|nr:hypothetical protein [Thiomargarita sp.]
IMGDVGDKLAELNNNAEYMLNENATKIFKKLEEQAVIPIAIHFKHKSTISKMYLHDKHRNEYTYETERRRNGEKQAWQNFKAHLNLIKPEHPFPLYTIGSTTRVESISTLTDNIKPVLTRIVTQISKLSKEMPKISLGQQAIKDLVCKKAFPKQSDLEVQCKQQSDWDKLTNFFEKHSSSNKNVGITISKFDALIKKNPELEAIIMTNPEIAFANGFIAVREKGEAITRPVLLLAFIEIKRITSEIDNITNFYRDCSVTQSIIHYKRVMATILGELLNINPDNVKEKEAKKWFGLVVDSKHSTLNSTNLIKRLCLKDENGKSPKWNNFLKRLETASRTLKDIVKKESKKRQFLDLQGYHYYWIYPEEILPSIPK